MNGTLYFSANDGVYGDERWRSDGTAAGTKMVADISPSGESTRNTLPRMPGNCTSMPATA